MRLKNAFTHRASPAGLPGLKECVPRKPISCGRETGAVHNSAIPAASTNAGRGLFQIRNATGKPVQKACCGLDVTNTIPAKV